MTQTVYIVSGGYAYTEMFQSLGWEVVYSITNASLVCFTGGEDVTPSMYGASSHPYTHSRLSRDQYEAQIFHTARIAEIPMVGICRGAQFLNVMSGGAMYQHVSNHTREHTITDATTGEEVYVSSTHHQMMKPSGKGVLVASSTLMGSREWYEGEIFKKDVSNQDIEVVYYEHTNCLCFQPHPEFTAPEYVGMRTYFQSLLKRFVETK